MGSFCPVPCSAEGRRVPGRGSLEKAGLPVATPRFDIGAALAATQLVDIWCVVNRPLPVNELWRPAFPKGDGEGG